VEPPAPGPYGYGVNPYGQGVYGHPNARFLRPDYGYGGGYRLPLLGGLGGGLLLGSLLL
jgi:hypothetical protein